MKPVKTGILVTDGAHARVYLNTGPGHGISEIKEYAKDLIHAGEKKLLAQLGSVLAV